MQAITCVRTIAHVKTTTGTCTSKVATYSYSYSYAVKAMENRDYGLKYSSKLVI